MNKGRLVWGIICLVLAVVWGSGVLFAEESVTRFLLAGTNLPWVPVIALFAVAVFLLATSRKPASAPASVMPPTSQEIANKALNDRLETAAWGLFLIMLGGFALVPDASVPKGAWAIGVGLIMLGLNVTRYYYKLRMSGFTTVLGTLSLLGGIAEVFGVTSLEGALLLIILGVYLIFKPWFESHRLFGKSEQSKA